MSVVRLEVRGMIAHSAVNLEFFFLSLFIVRFGYDYGLTLNLSN